ncbi:hypothetical protein ACFQHW_11030 [Lapidilactobacillus achengensis]|uniref:Uncharacterized protein n=1 Tax=Lapidilactobacillus achengensis TaxID=2486000 RepID=A0ABW1UQ47_9LACO|nr:hypothetical protein [Lapidilactobacillus achengensis]
MGEERPIQLIQQDPVRVHQADCTGVTNLKLVTTNHGRQLREASSIDHRLPVGVSAQTAVITLSGWSGEIRGEIAVKLSLAVYRLGQGLILRQAAHFADWLKTAPTASSPRISQRKPRPTLKHLHRQLRKHIRQMTPQQHQANFGEINDLLTLLK